MMEVGSVQRLPLDSTTRLNARPGTGGLLDENFSSKVIRIRKPHKAILGKKATITTTTRIIPTVIHMGATFGTE